MVLSIAGIPVADGGFYINLPTRTDRRASVEEQIEKYQIIGLERFEATVHEPFPSSATRTHRSCIQECKRRGWRTALILEDDFLIKDGLRFGSLFKDQEQGSFTETLETVLKASADLEWDVLMLGCAPIKNVKIVARHFGRADFGHGAWAYLIRDSVFDYIISEMTYYPSYEAVDDFLPRLNTRGYRCLFTIPKLISHAPGYSSLIKRFMDYTNMHEGYYQQTVYSRFGKPSSVQELYQNIDRYLENQGNH